MIPKKLNIKGTEYKVILKELVESSFGTAQGCCDTHKKVITIHNGLELEQLLITLLHEVGHAIFEEVSINNAVGREAEEIIVDNFATEFIKHFVDVGALQAEIDEANKKKKKKRK
jgi:hypothetical protein